MITLTVIALKGKDVMHSNLGKEKRELVPIAALKEGKVFAPLTFEGSAKSEAFLVVR